MGLFGNDDEQDARLDALESHVRNLSDGVQQNMLDLVEMRVLMIALRGDIKHMRGDIQKKLSDEDVDPAILELNEQLGVTRAELAKSAEAASESWSKLHSGAQDALDRLRASVADAAARIEREYRS